MILILVESPTKARTLSRFLGGKFRIEATFGHLRDLPKSEMGIDIEHEFFPKYIIPRDKLKRVKEITSLISQSNEVILATDPDREGEAIAFHITELVKSKSQKISNFSRITFHEITEEAIKEALNHPGKINLQLVNAQQARRVLDRLVGYSLSPLLWKKLSRRWLSAGRVQSVAVRLIVEREREIEKFKKEEYWVVEGEFSSNDKLIKAKLVSKDSVKYEKSATIKLFDANYTYSFTSIKNQQQVSQIEKDLQSPFTVTSVDKKETRRFPVPPFTTASLQIDAGRRLGFSSKRTMMLAQHLYERGLITYHRTDSTNLSAKFIDIASKYIIKNYGNSYSKPKNFTTKSKLAQEAHEAIRVTEIEIPNLRSQMTNELHEEHAKLYELIWRRAVASQMSEAVFDSTTINITSLNNYQFETQGSVVKFDGFLKVFGTDKESIILPEVVVGEKLELQKLIPEQKFTAHPPRYSEASLIKVLEEDGIGRPSTYAPTIATIVERLYVEKETKTDGKKGKNFVPTELGSLVVDFLVKYFAQIVDLKFTANMEDGLDQIADGKREWVPMLAEFYTPFNKQLDNVEQNVVKVEIPVEKTGEKCPLCNQGDVVIKEGRFGKFYACSRFPDCKYTRQWVEKLDMKCPTCKTGDVIVRKTRKGKVFYGCSRYPECKFASWTKPSAVIPTEVEGSSK